MNDPANVLSMSPDEPAYEWTEEKEQAAILLAQGYLIKEVAKAVGKNEKTIDRWKRDIPFQQQVDQLSHMLGAAGRAERLRIAMRVLRQKSRSGVVRTKKDTLDWLKFIQSETDGVNLNLTPALLAASALVAGRGQAGPAPESEDDRGPKRPKSSARSRKAKRAS